MSSGYISFTISTKVLNLVFGGLHKDVHAVHDSTNHTDTLFAPFGLYYCNLNQFNYYINEYMIYFSKYLHRSHYNMRQVQTGRYN